MNWQLGLQRISAVWWGFWALLTLLWTFIAIKESGILGVAVVLCLVPIYLLHKLTCWIVAGFFAPKGQP